VRVAVLGVVVAAGAMLLRQQDRRGVLELATLTTLGLIATPLIAFAVYFAAWHSLRHTSRLALDDGGVLRWGALARVARAGLPALLAAVAVVSLVTITHREVSSTGDVLWVALAVVWGLTVPHMVVVSRFDRRRRASTLVGRALSADRAGSRSGLVARGASPAGGGS
jgi:Brp/Blh family beta-carotene 15,15'-monooxygenase